MTQRLHLFNTTLRDGQQTQGVQFSTAEMMNIAADPWQICPQTNLPAPACPRQARSAPARQARADWRWRSAAPRPLPNGPRPYGQRNRCTMPRMVHQTVAKGSIFEATA
jgi:hypothetical protein